MVVVDPKYVVKTERLLLRPLKLEDAEDVALMRKDPEVMKHTSLLPTDDLRKTKEWIQGSFDTDNSWNFAIELLDTKSSSPRVIGLIGAVRTPEIGYMFNSSYWGKGYATEALRAFIPLFFEHFSGKEGQFLDYTEALTDPELVSSQNVLVKAGFKLYERKEKDFENPILGIRDTLVYRMERSAVTGTPRPM
ncbi:hypothetical protein HBI56_069710 [Parastagonospora nodorum]|uniref:N-acetyltransferase domain-containing protein n=1 Tax=Phaeosphaeria nodorum (strain SN15 / ATCC MYA-4574 / FGSC 10173) TaxID=321614 RepID=A0A7U2ENY0_PHANO|nr:hypothetical protein HBH56_004150 [Parastagonospora nodorum]QRC90324.1 hypothetical protein JI435_097270 [Parastagonospora nodorum SN15]KAH3938059.1 hypothetical protein HBH54_004140 [Parastagonospora nodorum]KAH3946584.1 hypothetical protein HBH53_127830 [Parastagonospora nodorum]KAH3978233.1 hypothetical protein HBH52_105850 [Parastagonospora nodorum]